MRRIDDFPRFDWSRPHWQEVHWYDRVPSGNDSIVVFYPGREEKFLKTLADYVDSVQLVTNSYCEESSSIFYERFTGMKFDVSIWTFIDDYYIT